MKKDLAINLFVIALIYFVWLSLALTFPWWSRDSWLSIWMYAALVLMSLFFVIKRQKEILTVTLFLLAFTPWIGTVWYVSLGFPLSEVFDPRQNDFAFNLYGWQGMVVASVLLPALISFAGYLRRAVEKAKE